MDKVQLRFVSDILKNVLRDTKEVDGETFSHPVIKLTKTDEIKLIECICEIETDITKIEMKNINSDRIT